MPRAPALHLTVWLLTSGLCAQQPAAAIAVEQVALRGRTPWPCAIVRPAGFAAEQWHPVLLAMPPASGEAAAVAAVEQRWGALAAAGWVVVCPTGGRDADLPALAAHLRQELRIEQGGMHLAAAEAEAVASLWRLALAAPHEFQSVTVWPAVVPAEDASLARLRGRRVFLGVAADAAPGAADRGLLQLRQRGVTAALAEVGPDAAGLARHMVAVHAERAAPGAAGAAARALDDFHDAAAKGDEDRYFAALPDDAVFLGTDPSERWTGAQFRAFAMPYFERGPAWTYVAFARHVTVAADGAFAWFDEALDNEAYGECRGSGVLERRGSRWVVRQYNLTIPVPNDLARGVVARIRAFAEGRAPAVTTVVLVRHAEKAAGDDPELTDAGRQRSEDLQRSLAALPVAAVYTSEFRRTAATVAPLCRSRNLAPTVAPAADAGGLARRIVREHAGQTVVVAGHSNTVPELLKALGVAAPVRIADDEFDRLFVVTLGPDGARLLELHYGR